MSLAMPVAIPRRRIPVSLSKADPTPLTVESLKRELTDVGLTCPAADEVNLEAYIQEVERQIPDGLVQTFSILRPVEPGEQAVPGLATGLAEASVGNWEPDSTGFGYGTVLEYIQYKAHFDWLMTQPFFTGITNDPPTYEGRYDTVDAVKQMFLTVAVDASATLVKGLDKGSLESVLSNAIAPLNDANARDYRPGPQSRVIFLVENYDPLTQEADGVGVLTLSWDLTIKDYKEKKESPKHETTLTVHGRSVLYSSLEDMNRDFLAAETHFKQTAFFDESLGIPRPPAKVTIFPNRPPANADTFKQSLPKLATEDELQVLVMFAPNLQNVGCIDNTNSDVTTDYSESVTSGFTFSATQTLSVEASFEASAEVVKAGMKVGLSISFTEQWSTSTTETMTFSVPPGKKAFTYQGYLLTQILSYDAGTGAYRYSDIARFLTNVLATSAVPMVDPA